MNNNMVNIDVGYERFLGPEMFFHPEFVHPALRSEGLAGRGRPGPGGLMGGGEGEGKLFYGEEGRQMRKPMEFRVSYSYSKI